MLKDVAEEILRGMAIRRFNQNKYKIIHQFKRESKFFNGKINGLA